jgi:DNA-binding NarL/FixJ family response regulator
MTKSGNYSVVLIDDHEVVRKALSGIVEMFPNFEVIGDVGGYQALESFLANGKPPDLLLLDIVMPGKDGFEVAEWMHKHYPSVKILALSSESKPETIVKIIKKGANGYIHKSCGPAELLNAMETVLKGNTYLSQKDFNTFSEALQNNILANDKDINFDDKEIEYIKLLCTSLTIKEISDKLFLSPRSLEDIKLKIGEKIGGTTRQEIALFAAKKGWV